MGSAAFAAGTRLIGEGQLGHLVRVAVRSAETPGELLDHADLTVDGPDGTLALLADLADLASPSTNSGPARPVR